MRHSLYAICAIAIFFISGANRWGFFAHERINRLAVFTLPPAMIGFYKKNIEYITEASVNPDRRRYFVTDEAARHYIDLDHYGDSAFQNMPRYWRQAVEQLSEDTLKAYGIVPWHVHKVFAQLRDAMTIRDPKEILRLSAELGHYIGDAHVPLHTTENYNGQLTGQEGIHAFWESRLPELFSERYDFFLGGPVYIGNTQTEAWQAVKDSHLALDSVLHLELELSNRFGERKFTFETKGKQTLKVYAPQYAAAYHKILNNMVERRMRCAIRCVANFWFTAWVDAGQPDLEALIHYVPTEEELAQRKQELQSWRMGEIKTRPHETPDH